jgi:hypothetical protein
MGAAMSAEAQRAIGQTLTEDLMGNSKTGTVGIGPGIGATVIGLILVIYGIACFVNYKGIVDYLHMKDVSAAKSLPALAATSPPGWREHRRDERERI